MVARAGGRANGEGGVRGLVPRRDPHAAIGGRQAGAPRRDRAAVGRQRRQRRRDDLDTRVLLARTVVRGIDTRSRNIESFDEIERGSIDFYATVRSLYRQYRASEIANGRGPENPLPEMSEELEEDNEAERVSSIDK